MTSIELSKKLNISHRAIILLLKKYIDDFKKYGEINIITVKRSKGTTGGRPYQYFELNDKQIDLLIIYLSPKNNIIKEYKHIYINKLYK
jgi:predicted ArsR family transcriptional regulator